MNIRLGICTGLIMLNTLLFVSSMDAQPPDQFGVMLGLIGIGVCVVAAYKNMK
jgi:hypothetical protein